MYATKIFTKRYVKMIIVKKFLTRLSAMFITKDRRPTKPAAL